MANPDVQICSRSASWRRRKTVVATSKGTYIVRGRYPFFGSHTQTKAGQRWSYRLLSCKTSSQEDDESDGGLR